MASVIEKQLKTQIQNLHLSPEATQALLNKVDEMADILYTAGWEEGYSDGLDTGYDDGFNDGFNEGSREE